MKTTKCHKCKASFDYEPTFLDEREIFAPTICQPCEAILKAEEKQLIEAEAVKKRQEKWAALCPEAYMATEIIRLPKHYQAAIHAWRFNAKGIAFVGQAGIGKTRAAFCILAREHFIGRRCHVIRATRLSAASIEKFDNDFRTKGRAREDIHLCHVAEILLIDDLGKGKFTPSAEEDLYDILESRTSRRRPTLWTANAMGDELAAKFSDDRCAAIIRRLVDFSDIL